MPASAPEPLDFLRSCGERAQERAGSALIAEGAAAFLRALSAATPLRGADATVAVAAELSGLRNEELDLDIGAAAAGLLWTPSTRGNDGGTEIAISPFNQQWDLGDVSAGLAMAGSGQVYPEHSHPPQELYFVLSGTGSWRYGGNDFYKDVCPGTTFYNPPGVTHGLVAGDAPVVALYVLW